MSRLALALLLLWAAPVAALADDGTCVEPIEVTQQAVGRRILVSVVFALQSPGRVYVCPNLPDDALAVTFRLRRQLPDRLRLPEAALDSCVTWKDEGVHPVDGFARVRVDDMAGSYQCIVGPDAEGEWHMVPARRQFYRATWDISP